MSKLGQVLVPHVVTAWCSKGLILYSLALLIINSALHLRVHAVVITVAQLRKICYFFSETALTSITSGERNKLPNFRLLFLYD